MGLRSDGNEPHRYTYGEVEGAVQYGNGPRHRVIKPKINKYHLIIGLIILTGPVLDLMTGFLRLALGVTSEMTPGVLYRGIVLIPSFLVAIFRLRSSYFRIVVAYFFLVFFVGVGIHYVSGHEIDLVGHTQRFLKTVFPILGFGALVYLGDKYPRSQSSRFLWKVTGLYGLITAGSIVLFFVLGIGVSTYRFGFSFKGFYASQNSMGFILVTSLIALLFYIHAYKNSNLFLFLFTDGLFLLSAFLVGTRAAILGVPSAAIGFHLFMFLRPGRRVNLSWIVYGALILIGAVIIGFVVYRFWAQQDTSFIRRKFDLLFSGNGVSYGTQHFRAKVPLGIEQISHFDVQEHLFGIGDADFALTENDLVDIYGKFGLLTLVPLLLFFARYYAGVLSIFLKKRSPTAFALLLPLSFYILHASLAGHALTIAQSNNLAMLLYYLSYQEITLSRRKQSLETQIGVTKKRYGRAT